MELDVSFIGTPKTGDKRGRVTKKNKVLAGLSIDIKGRSAISKMKAASDFKSATIIDFEKCDLRPETKINGDAYHSCRALMKLIIMNLKSLTRYKILTI